MIRGTGRPIVALVCIILTSAPYPAIVGCVQPDTGDGEEVSLQELLTVGSPLMTPVGAYSASGFSSAAFKWIGDQVAGAIVGQLTEIGFGYVLSFFGYESADEQMLKQIAAKLDVMDQKLDGISTRLTALSTQMDTVLAAVNLSTARIVAEVNALEMKQHIDHIKDAYLDLKAYRVGATHAFSSAGREQAAAFARRILEGDRIGGHLFSLHTSITAESGTTGVLDAMTDLLIRRMNAEKDRKSLYACYLALEAYFGWLLAIEGQGLVLMTEAINQSATIQGDAVQFTGPGAGSVISTWGSAKEYYENKFTPNIERQVDRFLACVDKLVLSQADIRTDLASPVAFLPNLEDVENIYAAADFLAQQVSARHKAGIIARLIGEPGNIEAALDQGAISCGGQKMDAVPVNGNAINYYDSPRAYLEGQWGQDERIVLNNTTVTVPDDHRRFRPATRIAVLKVSCPVPSEANWTDGTVSVTHEPGQEACVAYYDDNYQPVSGPGEGRVQYGHVVFPIRHTPRLLDFGSAILAKQGGWSLQGRRDMTAMKTTVGVSCTVTCSTDYYAWAYGGYYVPVTNASDTDVVLTASGSCSNTIANGLSTDSIRWRSGQLQAATGLQVLVPGAAFNPSATQVNVFTSSTATPSPFRVENLTFPAGKTMLIDYLTLLHTGTFYYRSAPRTRLTWTCKVPRPATATATTELNSLELAPK